MPTPANEDRPGPERFELGDEELQAYVAGGLSPARRAQVEGFLACNPDLAAHAMRNLHQRGARSGGAGRVVALLVAGAGVAGCLLSGLIGWNVASAANRTDGWRGVHGGDPPAYVEEAAESAQAGRVRQMMRSQVESPQLDAAEIHQALNVRLPRLPQAWRLIDVKVDPTDEGPAVSLVIDDAGERLVLFVVRADTPAGERPALAARGADVVAFWERGDSAFVLSGASSRADLLSKATVLAKSATL